MAWEYLYDKMDFRVWTIAGYLKGKTKDKVIFDLNGMHCPLLKYIDHDYKEYIANDLQTVFPSEYPRCRFHTISDVLMIYRLPVVDIMIAIGIGGHEITNEPLESPTSTESTISIINKCKPSIVILENIQDFRSVMDNIIRNINYKVVQELKIDAPQPPEVPYPNVFKRELIFLEL